MSNYCKTCNYESYDNSNWNRHLETKKHKQNMILNDLQNKNIPDLASWSDDSGISKKKNDLEKSITCDNKNLKSGRSTRIKKTEKNSIFSPKSDTDSENTKSRLSTRIEKKRGNQEFDEKKSIIENSKVSQSTRFENNCRYCSASFSHKSGLYRHEKYRCTEKNKVLVNETDILKSKLENEIYEKLLKQFQNEFEKKELQWKLKETQERLAEKEKQLDNEHKLNMNLQENGKTAMATLHNSVNALTFLTQQFKKAPVLRKLTHESAKKLLLYEKRLSDYLVSSNEDNKLDQYIGDIILKYIKMENPEQQSVWNSDVARLTYIIRTAAGNKHVWERDPKGELFIKYVIGPILEYLKEYLMDRLEAISHDPIPESMADRDDIMEHARLLGDVLHAIKVRNFSKKIATYIASHIALKQASQD